MGNRTLANGEVPGRAQAFRVYAWAHRTRAIQPLYQRVLMVRPRWRFGPEPHGTRDFRGARLAWPLPIRSSVVLPNAGPVVGPRGLPMCVAIEKLARAFPGEFFDG